MKRIIVLLLAITVTSLVISQTPDSADLRVAPNPGDLTFEVKLNKTSYLPFEPVSVRFKLSNQTGGTLKVERPQFLLHSSVKVSRPDDSTVEIGNLSLTSGGGVNLPGGNSDLPPHQSYEEDGVPAIDPNVFAEPGNYKLQFFLNGLESNIAEMEVITPQGLDQAAFRFIAKHGKDIWFGRMLQEKDGEDLLKNFVERFGSSGYGAYGIGSLGKYYLFFEKDIDKAKAEFEKIKSSENPVVAKTVSEALANIANKETELRDLEKHKANWQ